MAATKGLSSQNIPLNNSNIWGQGVYAIIPLQNVDTSHQEDIKKEENFIDEETEHLEFVCNKCNVMFISRSELEYHYMLHDEFKSFSPFSFISQSYVSSRLRMHTNKRLNTVTNVNKTIISEIRPASPVNNSPMPYTADQDIASNVNNAVLQNKSAMFEIRSQDKSLKLKKSRKKISNLQSNSENNISKKVNKIHSYNGKFECFQCTFVSKKMSEIASHISVHNKDKAINTSYVSQHKNKSKSNENNHMQIKKYSCNDCNFLTYEVEEFKYHLKTHKNRIPHKCEECEESFINLQLIMCASVQKIKTKKSKNNNKLYLNSRNKETKLQEGNGTINVKSPIVVLERLKMPSC